MLEPLNTETISLIGVRFVMYPKLMMLAEWALEKVLSINLIEYRISCVTMAN